MRLIALRETARAEHRVAVTPESAKGLIQKGFEVALEAGAGAEASFPDEEYTEQGATIETDRSALLQSADAWLAVQAPRVEDVGYLRSGSFLVGFLQPYEQHALVSALAKQKVTSFAMELLLTADLDGEGGYIEQGDRVDSGFAGSEVVVGLM